MPSSTGKPHIRRKTKKCENTTTNHEQNNYDKSTLGPNIAQITKFNHREKYDEVPEENKKYHERILNADKKFLVQLKSLVL